MELIRYVVLSSLAAASLTPLVGGTWEDAGSQLKRRKLGRASLAVWLSIHPAWPAIPAVFFGDPLRVAGAELQGASVVSVQRLSIPIHPIYPSIGVSSLQVHHSIHPTAGVSVVVASPLVHLSPGHRSDSSCQPAIHQQPHASRTRQSLLQAPAPTPCCQQPGDAPGRHPPCGPSFFTTFPRRSYIRARMESRDPML